MSGQNGKGSKRRPGDENAYRENYDRIFGKKRKPKEDDEIEYVEPTKEAEYWVGMDLAKEEEKNEENS